MADCKKSGNRNLNVNSEKNTKNVDMLIKSHYFADRKKLMFPSLRPEARILYPKIHTRDFLLFP